LLCCLDVIPRRKLGYFINTTSEILRSLNMSISPLRSFHHRNLHFLAHPPCSLLPFIALQSITSVLKKSCQHGPRINSTPDHFSRSVTTIKIYFIFNIYHIFFL